MNRRSLLLLAVLVAAIAVGGTSSRSSQAHAGEVSLVWWLDNPAQVSGTPVPEAYSILLRGYFSVTVTMQTSGLTPDHTYTLWWAIFQSPNLCVNGCGDDDINAALAGPNPIGIGVHYGGTFTATDAPQTTISARLLENTLDGCVTALPYSPLCVPMTDAATAEVLVFLVDNGPASGKPVMSFDAGCRDLVWFGYVVAQYNMGDFDCYRAQSTFHQP